MTAYASAKGAIANRKDKTAACEDTCWWWLRSPGHVQRATAGIDYEGSADTNGCYVSNDIIGVRPALWIKLEP